jgi:xyloglucan fucosyltransferase
MKRLKKNQDDDNDIARPQNSESHILLRDPDRKSGPNPMKLMGILVVCLMVISVLFSVSVVLKDPPSDNVWKASSETSFVHVGTKKGTCFWVF